MTLRNAEIDSLYLIFLEILFLLSEVFHNFT